MKFNINNYVSFTLTASGAKVWNARSNILIGTPAEKYIPTPVEVGSVVKAQLHEVISVFGTTTGLGYEAFCENCEIELEEDK